MLIGGQERHPEVRGNLRPDVCQRWRGDHYQRLRGEAGPQAGNEGKNIMLSVENICVRMENICVQIENICKSGIFSCWWKVFVCKKLVAWGNARMENIFANKIKSAKYKNISCVRFWTSGAAQAGPRSTWRVTTAWTCTASTSAPTWSASLRTTGLAEKLMLSFCLINDFFSMFRMEMEAAVKHRTQFYIEDAMTMEYPENFYDVVYRWSSVRASLELS